MTLCCTYDRTLLAAAKLEEQIILRNSRRICREKFSFVHLTKGLLTRLHSSVRVTYRKMGFIHSVIQLRDVAKDTFKQRLAG